MRESPPTRRILEVAPPDPAPPPDLTESGQVPAEGGWEGPDLSGDELTGRAKILMPALSRPAIIPNQGALDRGDADLPIQKPQGRRK